MGYDDVGCSVPLGLFCGGGEAGEAKTGEDGCAFGEGPDGVVFASFEGAVCLEEEEAG